MDSDKIGSLIGKIFEFVAAAVMPSIVLFFLYGNNKDTNALSMGHFLLYSLCLAIVSILLLFTIKRVNGKERTALLSLLTIWSFFWFFKNLMGIYDNFVAETTARRFVLRIVVIFILLTVFVFKKIRCTVAVYNCLAIMVSLLFLYNFIPQLLPTTDGKLNLVNHLKTDFIVDDSLPHPNIYWFHLDSTMSFENVLRYFNDPQTELVQELTSKGFVINDSAYVPAGAAGTGYAVPSLLSPNVYDAYFRTLFDRVFMLPRDSVIDKRITQSINYMNVEIGGVNTITETMKNPELYTAFSKIGYLPITVATPDAGFRLFSPIYRFYEYDHGIPEPAKYTDSNVSGIDLEFNNFLKLITDSSMLSAFNIKSMSSNISSDKDSVFVETPEYAEQVSQYNAPFYGTYGERLFAMHFQQLYDIISYKDTPKIVYFESLIQHAPYGYDENGKVIVSEKDYPPSSLNVYSMPLAYENHKFIIKIVLQWVKMIIDNEPDAIIILQADHGPHLYEESIWMLSNGYTTKQTNGLAYGTFSAIRIPEKYGGLDKPLNPMNITRELVNRYVGAGNYELLPDQIPFDQLYDELLQSN